MRLTLRLYPGEDDDLVAFFASLSAGLRAACVKRALREGVITNESQSMTDDPLLMALDQLVD